jgi:hypothetical protein
MSPAIILCTLNAKYIHASLGLRYLLANMRQHGGVGLRERTVLREFTIARPVPEIVSVLLADLGDPVDGAPQIIGFGVYIWNVVQTTEVVRQLKQARPTLKIILGGPEVSYEWEDQAIVRLADYLITGWGDVSLPKLCRALLHGPQPLMKVIPGEQPPLAEIDLPYAEFNADDLAHRLLYVEASRGCPFKCEFCLSSLDKTAWAFDQERFLAALEMLYLRGARNFKFVDRTFNLKIDSSLTILQFFLDRLTPDLFLHFEVIPDHLPERLKEMIARFPPGVLQFEVGIQTFNPAVQQAISRRQDNEKPAKTSPGWSTTATPTCTPTSFSACPAKRWPALAKASTASTRWVRTKFSSACSSACAARPSRDTARPMAWITTSNHPTPSCRPMRSTHSPCSASPGSPATGTCSPIRAASANPARLAGRPSPFAAFLAFSDWLWLRTGQTSRLTPETLLDALFGYLTSVIGRAHDSVRQTLFVDYRSSGARANPACLEGLLKDREKPVPRAARALVQRQDRHVSVGE